MPGPMGSMMPQMPSRASWSRTGVSAASSGVLPPSSLHGRSEMPSRIRRRTLPAVMRECCSSPFITLHGPAPGCAKVKSRNQTRRSGEQWSILNNGGQIRVECKKQRWEVMWDEESSTRIPVKEETHAGAGASAFSSVFSSGFASITGSSVTGSSGLAPALTSGSSRDLMISTLRTG